MKYNELVSTIKSPFFFTNDTIFSGLTIYPYQLSIWVNKEYLVKLKNGMYAFTRDFHKLKGEDIVSLLYQPSYLSLESALSFYGLIPETVYSYVSVTAKINRTFNNKLGNFIYRHIKNELFWGYIERKTENGWYLIAEPEKAVLDYLYLNLRKIRNQNDFENIRFNAVILKELIDKDKFIKYLAAFKNKKLHQWAMRCLQ